MTASILLLMMAGGCNEKGADIGLDGWDSKEEMGHDQIVLGKKLEDPYSIANVTKALANLYPTKADRIDITPTDVYVRFLPKSEEEYQRLVDAGYDLMDHPLDYKIIRDGDYYHDPEIEEEDITWQYAVIPHGAELPEGIEHEVLDDCYIPETGTKSDDGIDWEAVEREAFRLTGNEDMLSSLTRGGAEKPEGRITIVDKDANGGKPFGVAGVKVVCNVFVKFASAYTDRDGYYKIGKSYSSNPRYRLMFKNKKDFAIGFNKIVVPASTSALGKDGPDGKDAEITIDSDRKLWCRAVVNNAAYDYITRCGADDMNITRPPKKLRLWIFQKANSSSAVMMRQGAVIDNALVKSFLGEYSSILKAFLPDITIGAHNDISYSTLYSTTCHELAHASHFAQVGKDYWDKYIRFIITSFVSSGGVTYGTGQESDAGYCEIGEMWAYYLQNKMYNERYGGEMPSAGLNFWFHPQIFRYLDERGISRSQLFAALTKDVKTKEALRLKLLELYPDKQQIIQQVFLRYAL